MFKQWLKALGVFVLINIVLADLRSDCEEICDLFVIRDIPNKYGSFGICEIDEVDDKEFIRIRITQGADEDLSTEVLKKIFSYNIKHIDIGEGVTENIVNALKVIPRIEEISITYGATSDTISSSFYTLENLKKLILGISIDKKIIDGLTKMSKLEELYFENIPVIENYTPSNNSMTNLKYFSMYNYNCGEDALEIPEFIYDAKNLETMYLDGSCISGLSKNVEKLKSLKHLTSRFANIILPEQFSKLDNLETIELHTMSLTEFPKQILNLKNLKKIDFKYNTIKSIPEEIGSFENLEELDLGSNQITVIPKQIGNLKNLKVLNLNSNAISNFVDELGKLESLEELYLSRNKIDSELPTSLNDLKNLKNIDVARNVNVKGKILTNESLESCLYSVKYELCKPLETIKCLNDEMNGAYKLCSDENIKEDDDNNDIKDNETENSNDDNNSNDIEDNETEGSNDDINNSNDIEDNETEDSNDDNNNSDDIEDNENEDSNDDNNNSDDIEDNETEDSNDDNNNSNDIEDNETENSNDDSNDFDDTKENIDTEKPYNGRNDTDDIKISTDGRCGKGFGKCRKGFCCSRLGWCGNSVEHCAASNGCKPKYGKCRNDIIIKTSKCGKGHGKCSRGHGKCGRGHDKCH